MTLPPQQLYIGSRPSGELIVLDLQERRRHLYVVGQTGTGKSTLLLNLIRQDLVAREGLALLDPHGDLAEAALAHVPRARTNDLVYLNPADLERPIGFNPLSRVSDDLKPIVADGVVSAFRHVWPDSWGPRLDYILTNAVRALLDVPGATLLMLPRPLIDESFRVSLIAHHVSDPVVRSFWMNEYAGYSDSFRNEAVAPIQNKIGKALMVPSLRNMLAQPSSTITFRRLMDEGAIVICNLSKGSLGESTAHLLGALITTARPPDSSSQLNADAGEMFDHARADLDQSFPDGRELALGERIAPRDSGAHAMHQPERGGVEDEPHLIGGRAVTRHAIRRQLRLVQLDQVLHLPALAIDGLVKMPRRALERGDDVADVDLLAHAGRPYDRLQRALTNWLLWCRTPIS